MSLETFARVWANSPASGNALLVHLALADLAMGKLVQVPQAEIADLARCSVTTAARALQELVELKVIEVVDDRCKPTIYRFNHQIDGISTQLRMDRVDNRQIDGILQHDGIEPQESGQIGGEAVQRTEDVKSARDVHPPMEANIGQPIPITTGYVADVPLREPTPPAPPPTFRAMTAAAVQPKAGDPVMELAAFLHVIGVKQNPEAPLYWFRDEHVKDFEGLLRLADKSGAILINEVRAAGIKMPDLRRIPDIHDRLAAAKIIPF